MVAQVGERLTVHLPHARLAFALIDVVAVMEHEIEWFLGNVPPGRVVPFLEMLAAGHHEAHARDRCVRRRQGVGAPDRTGMASHGEAIPVRPPRQQAIQFHV
ncbi:hypothetical protein D3C81_523420 [compost metagenome]